MYSIGQLAKESETTVRTLRYYDEIGLLKPSLISDGGHRYYEEHDFIKLHSIRIYKKLGLSLSMIQQVLNNNNSDHKSTLKLQLNIFELERSQLDEKIGLIRSLLQVSELEQLTNWQQVNKIIPKSLKVTSLEQLEELWNKDFSSEEIAILKSIPKIGDDHEIMDEYIFIINEIRLNLPLDYQSDLAQQFAKRYVDLLDQLYQGDFELAQKVWAKHKNSNGKIGMYQIDPAIGSFVEKAIGYYMSRRLL
ncbi:MerR family transcriptional regulator [Paenisporosarcina macmurdoensis]|uniref:MerR family transcriptional regulator n=1 Tax=Paenisporosarcina macmurdoensis TaxID=212659 RepID=A0ABW1LB78_9BACL